MAFQPILYLSMWLAALIILVVGDRHTVPFPDNANALYWVWGGLSLTCPMLALLALRMLRRDTTNSRWKYRGLWVRLGADIGQFTAMSVYLALRISEGDYHVYPTAALMAGAVFVLHLIIRDVKRLHRVEGLATDLRNGNGHGDLQ